MMNKLIFIVLLSISVSCCPVIKYADLPEVKAWETDIEKFEKLDKTETYPSNAVLFAGSSSIRLWENLTVDMAPYPVIQRGYGGAKLSDLAVYAERIFSPHQCVAIVIFVANDISQTDNDKSPEEVASLYSYLIKTIRKSHPETPIFWIAITPTPSRWKVWPEIEKANTLIQNKCNENKNTYFIKTDSAFLNEKGVPIEKYFRNDKLHLSEEGYKVWKEIIKSDLKKVVPEPNN
jgi:lysophospholipase L1-like esterase